MPGAHVCTTRPRVHPCGEPRNKTQDKLYTCFISFGAKTYAWGVCLAYREHLRYRDAEKCHVVQTRLLILIGGRLHSCSRHNLVSQWWFSAVHPPFQPIAHTFKFTPCILDSLHQRRSITLGNAHVSVKPQRSTKQGQGLVVS